MRRKIVEQEEARQLRRDGWSVRAIAAELGVAKSSVSVWVRGIAPPLPRPKRPSAPPPLPPPVSGETRRCPRCSRTLPVEAFNRAGSGRQHWCRECFRQYFRERGEVHRRQVAATAPERRERTRRLALSILSGASCADCGLDDVVVLEFDHLGPKRADVARLVGGQASERRLRAEIDACEIVCANCHRRRTAQRAGWFRATGRPGRLWSAAQLRNQEFVVDVLRTSGCQDCGERDPVVLDFDHREDKRGNVSTMATWAGLDTLRREMAKCDVRCVNCHRRRTLEAVGSYRLTAVKSVSPP